MSLTDEAMDERIRANIDSFIASVAPRFIDCDILEVGAGFAQANEAVLSKGNRYRRTDRGTFDLLSDHPEREIADVVVATEVLEHVTDPPIALKTCFDMLRPNGTLVLSVPWLYREHGDEDYWRFAPKGLDLLLKRAGFDRVESSLSLVEGQTTSLFRVARKP